MRRSLETTGYLTELHDRVMASDFGLGAPSSQVGQAFLEGGDFADPDVVAGFGQSGFGVGGHLFESSELGGGLVAAAGAVEEQVGLGAQLQLRPACYWLRLCRACAP